MKYRRYNSRGPYRNYPASQTELRSFCRHLTSLGYSTSAKYLRQKIDLVFKQLEKEQQKVAKLTQELADLKKEYLGLHKIEE